MLMRYLATVNLPKIAGAQDQITRQEAEDELGGVSMVAATLIAIGFYVLGPFAVRILYGPAFSHSGLLIAMIGVLQAARLMRQWPTTTALAMGKSSIVLGGSIIRMIGLAGAVAGEFTIGGLYGIVLGLILGEFLALGTALYLINRQTGLPILAGFDRFASFVAASASLIGWAYLIAKPQPLGIVGVGTLTLACVAWIVRREARTFDIALAIARRAIPGSHPRSR
jgi:O-antigen/teichoic acid export membrane protein